MRLKIVTDNQAFGTRLMTETGEVVADVTSITCEWDKDSCSPVAVVRIRGIEIEVCAQGLLTK